MKVSKAVEPFLHYHHGNSQKTYSQELWISVTEIPDQLR